MMDANKQDGLQRKHVFVAAEERIAVLQERLGVRAHNMYIIRANDLFWM